ncbi:methyl-accepting chemotaxis protein [Colwellia maritima]|uniref:methyl-accepting chemotaxis protein n=1 Tax=Colwellia maritima TaxID=2912588 RepID=UPI00237BBD21|nr:methyl-accepting chemotaxis protein [Colwellia maritima]
MWTENHWDHLSSLVSLLNLQQLDANQAALLQKRQVAPDFSEIFILDANHQIVASTYANRVGDIHDQRTALAAVQNKPFLHGPYVDPITLKIGASTSKFHDEVTLMFYFPIIEQGEVIAIIGGRVPNDVLGDLIQREAGHIYPESGDNYLFMVNSVFDRNIKQGTALSRSRFEDNTFSHGENLKTGINTGFGTVKIKRHTELEIRFTDPATGELHPGVRETINNGQNLFVTYPGYSDYRHIPVIGKGVTFQLPGSPDTWGMMCEGDLEEVYRRRSINIALMKLYLVMVTSIVVIHSSISEYTDFSSMTVNSITGVCVLLSTYIFSMLGTNKVSKRLNGMTRVLRTIAEGEGNLTQRLDPRYIKHDETGDMSRWINSFIDNLDGIVGQVIHASGNVKKTNELMLQRNEEAHHSSHQVHESMVQMQGMIETQRDVILHASNTAEDMKLTMAEVVETAKKDYEDAREGTYAIREIVDSTAKSVQSIDARMSEIGNITNVITEITNQTNLLALNAAIEAARLWGTWAWIFCCCGGST